MPRPIEFDKSQALSTAIEVIWYRGYHAVSTNELTAEIGLAKSSFYNTFGSKREVLLTALRKYSEERPAELARALDHRPFFKSLRALLTTVVRDNHGGKGCLLVNSAVEVAPHDIEIAAIVREGFTQMSRVIESAVRAAQERGEVGPDFDPKDCAVALVSAIAGLSVLAKAGMGGNALVPSIEGLLSKLER